ncbi:MAG: hypothetical protein IIB77_11560, partial [Proteobacteria bacterium]|nr:hypothetical protein [Pseudomonadota bacterium]
MNDFIASVQAMAELVGPYLYLQALLIALVFIFFGKIADWIFSAMLTRIAKRSATRVDDEIVELLHRPIFLSFILLGLAIATEHIDMADLPEKITLSILKTIAILIWYTLFFGLITIFANE